MVSKITVVYRKYDGSLHWNFPARLLGSDEHGTWVGCPEGTVAHKGSVPQVSWAQPAVLLFPSGSWWTAMFNAEPHKVVVYCDVTSVPEWRDGMVTMIDLDLDVIGYRDGRVILDDEDEFAEHRVRYGYPDDVVTNAGQAASSLMKAVADGAGAFGGAHEHWLAEVR